MTAQDRETLAEGSADLYFGPFRLEKTKRLWRGEELVEVRPRPLAMLRYLAERPNRLVTGDELLNRLWPGIYVTRTVLRVCVRELRQALQDGYTTPQYIETIGRQGYQFIAPISAAAPPVISNQRSVVSLDEEQTQLPQLVETANRQRGTPFVGRVQELARLREVFERARRGERQILFLFGEPGIGKTALVDRFLDHMRTSEPVRIGRGQCIEQYGSGEAYLPLLEVLGQLCREPGGEQVLTVLRRHAPTWLAQMPGLLKAGELEAVQRQGQGMSRERMLRELAEAIEAIAADAVLVLVLEDLQWSDISTLDVLAYLAKRRQPVQLYVVGTYRPVEVVMQGHPLRRIIQDLAGQRRCEELALELLTQEEVEQYLRQRLGERPDLRELSEVLYQQSDGNALFLVSFVDALLPPGEVEDVGSPEGTLVALPPLPLQAPRNLQQVVLRQVERLAAEEQQLLELASGAGRVFTAAEVAEVSGRPLEEVEEVCDHLATHGSLIREIGLAEWADKMVTVRYEFRHALYQEVMYEQLGQGQRVRLHRQFGEWKEQQYGAQATRIAGELAVHFTIGREYQRAVQYHYQAGVQALRLYAPREAIVHCTEGVELLSSLPDTPDRRKQELALRMTLGAALTAIYGHASSELEQNLKQAHALCQELGETAALVPVLTALTWLYMVRADRATTEAFFEQQRQFLLQVQTPADAILLHTQMGTVELWRGAHARSQEHHTQVLELYDVPVHRSLLLTFGLDPKSVALASYGWSLCLSGWPERAWSWERRALEHAEELAHPFSLVNTLMFAIFVRGFRGEGDEALALIQQLVDLVSEHGFRQYRGGEDLLQGSVLVGCGELEQSSALLTRGLALFRTTPARLLLPYFLSFLAEASLRQGQVESGLATVAEALGLTTTDLDCFWEAELYRLQGELTLQQESQKAKVKKQKSKSKSQKAKVKKPKSQILDPQSEAEACFLKAIEVAQQQGAKSLELRAAMSLARLWQQQGKRPAARNTLATIYGWFTEGFETRDLQEAKALLDTLSA